MIEGYVVEIKHTVGELDNGWHPLNGFFEKGETYGGLSARQAAYNKVWIHHRPGYDIYHHKGIWTSARVRKVVLLYI